MARLRYTKFVIISLVMVYFSCNAQARTLERKNALEHALDTLITAQAPTATVGIKIVTLDDGTCVYGKNSKNLLVPASTLKLVTAAAALYYLGPAYQFKTQLLSDGTVTDGVMQGNLYIKFSGDPSLVTQDLERLVLELKKRNITTVTGTVALDTSMFDDIQMGPGWMWDQGPAVYNSPVHACTVNHNCITVSVKPAENKDTAPSVFIEPAGACQFVTVDNKAVTTDIDNKSKLSIERDWQGHTDTIIIEGSIVPNTLLITKQCTVERPLVYGAMLCKQLLEQAGIIVQGELVKAHAPENAQVLATHYSVSLSQLLHTMLKQSDNLYAECLCKALGAHKRGTPGTWAKGAAVLTQFLSEVVGITSDFTIVDGSGFSRYNLLSADQVVQLLLWVQKQFTLSYEFTAALARAGQDGTLKQRMQEDAGTLRAKTGTLAGVSALSGYYYTKTGQPLAFALIINGFTQPAQIYKTQLEDALVRCLDNSQKDQKELE